MNASYRFMAPPTWRNIYLLAILINLVVLCFSWVQQLFMVKLVCTIVYALLISSYCAFFLRKKQNLSEFSSKELSS